MAIFNGFLYVYQRVSPINCGDFRGSSTRPMEILASQTCRAAR